MLFTEIKIKYSVSITQEACLVLTQRKVFGNLLFIILYQKGNALSSILQDNIKFAIIII